MMPYETYQNVEERKSKGVQLLCKSASELHSPYIMKMGRWRSILLLSLPQMWNSESESDSIWIALHKYIHFKIKSLMNLLLKARKMEQFGIYVGPRRCTCYSALFIGVFILVQYYCLFYGWFIQMYYHCTLLLFIARSNSRIQ